MGEWPRVTRIKGGQLRTWLLQQLLQIEHDFCVCGQDVGHSNTGLPGSSCTTYAMGVVLNVVRHVEVDHMRHSDDIDTSAQHIGRYQDILYNDKNKQHKYRGMGEGNTYIFAVLESVKRVFSLFLSFASMQNHHLELLKTLDEQIKERTQHTLSSSKNSQSMSQPTFLLEKIMMGGRVFLSSNNSSKNFFLSDSDLVQNTFCSMWFSWFSLSMLTDTARLKYLFCTKNWKGD